MRLAKYIITLAFLLSFVYAQTTLNPKVTDNGGGIRTGTGYKLVASIGQAVPGISTSASGELEAGFVTVELNLTEIQEPASKPPMLPTIGLFYPNPFNSTTKMEITMPIAGKISLEFFDISGKQIFHWESEKAQGRHALSFTASDILPSGIYVYRITAPNAIKTGKIVFAR